jgi:hypothetical protein
MATTTPNFGWPVPTSTDLVKDGATAIESLGDSIDASLLDLKGGTSGQVLAKNSNTDMDFTWVAQDDSNAIQNAIVDAKGDLIGATAADTPARLAVGTNGQVLTADSTAATGLAWATAASGGMTLLSTTTLSGTSTTVSITPTGYVSLYFTINKIGFTGGATELRIRLNGTTSANYVYNNRDRDNTWTKSSSQTSIGSGNGYDNSDAQYCWGQLTLPNATNKRPTVETTYYFNSAANQGFAQSWGANEAVVAAISSITFFSGNGTSTFVNSPQLLIYGVK